MGPFMNHPNPLPLKKRNNIKGYIEDSNIMMGLLLPFENLLKRKKIPRSKKKAKNRIFFINEMNKGIKYHKDHCIAGDL